MKCKVLVPSPFVHPGHLTQAITLTAETTQEQAALAWLASAVITSGTVVCHAINRAAQIKFTTGDGDVEYVSLPVPPTENGDENSR